MGTWLQSAFDRLSVATGRSVLPLLLICGFAAGTLAEGEWIGFRSDAQRSGYLPVAHALEALERRSSGADAVQQGTPEAESDDRWHESWSWSWQSPQPPRPAWPPPARGSLWQRLESIQPRNTDDHTFHPVVAGGLMLFCSSADDRVRAFDIQTGRLVWQHNADGPIRYAPIVLDGAVLLGGDDGVIRCLELDTGTVRWTYRVGPQDRRIPGNDRLISTWPIRTGLVGELDSEGGIVYATAGLYPQQGCFAVALRVKTGEVIWRQTLEDSPQGYLLLSDAWVIVPTGRSTPIALDRRDGSKVRTFQTEGGTFAVLSGSTLYAGSGNDGTVTTTETASGQRLVSTRARQLVVAPDRSYWVQEGQLIALDRQRQLVLTQEARDLERRIRRNQERLRTYEAGDGGGGDRERILTSLRSETQAWGRRLAEVNDALQDCLLWQVPCGNDRALAASETLVAAGGVAGVTLYRAEDGSVIGHWKVPGTTLGLALTAQHLVATTDIGRVAVLDLGGEDASPSHVASVDQPDSTGADVGGISQAQARTHERVRAWMKSGLSDKGYAVVLGVGSGHMVDALAALTELHVVAMGPSSGRMTALRERWTVKGLYGRRISVIEIPDTPLNDGRILPTTDFFANVVISENAWEGDPIPEEWRQEAERVIRPFGGFLALSSEEPLRRTGPLPGAGSWTHQYGNVSNTANSGDERIRRDLNLQWFGGPGPSRMVDRHLRAPAPLSAGGRLFVPGENSLIAVDAYNGVELWERELPGSQRYSMPYDAGYFSLRHDQLAVAVQDACWLLDPVHGERTQTLTLSAVLDPQSSVHAAAGTADVVERKALHWGYVAFHDGSLFGSFQKATASRTDASYARIDVDYNNDQPLVTGLGLFRMQPDTGRREWVYDHGVILNTTITLKNDRLYFVEAQDLELRAHETGRILLAEFMAARPRLVCLDIHTGKPHWKQDLSESMMSSQNILFVSATEEFLILLGSHPSADRDTTYRVECLDSQSGKRVWSAQHQKGAPGQSTHGEQVHHPVILGEWLVCEPALYKLATGERVTVGDGSDGQPQPWRLVRPGHSCGTLSGAADCLFFRANNPTVYDVRAHLTEGTRPRSLAPTRTGCWINVIPAGGLVLIPEASAGCVCNYSLQTSMAFLPAH